MVWPILISVSVIPGASTARAGRPAAAKAAAAALQARNVRRVVMKYLPRQLAISTNLSSRGAFSRTRRVAAAHRCEFVEKSLGCDEIGAIKSFREFFVNRPQEGRGCSPAHG